MNVISIAFIAIAFFIALTDYEKAFDLVEIWAILKTLVKCEIGSM